METATLTALGAGVTVAGVGLVIYVTRVLRLGSRKGRRLAGAGMAIAGLGILAVIAAIFSGTRGVQEIDTRPNPFPPTENSLAAGERVYRAHCQSCHGPDGHGDGPDGATLRPRPTDFWVHFASGHTHPDGRLFYWITNGMGGTGMPAFGGQLSDAERWDVVNFIRTFTPADR